MQDIHLIFVQHGMLGMSYFFENFKKKIENSIHNSIVIIPKENNFLYSIFGTKICGDKLVKSIYDTLEKYPNTISISFISHSFGGILTRYAIGVLEKDGLFDKIKPMAYISISSPHVGVITDKSIVKFGLKYITGTTGKELIGDIPILEHLSKKNSEYVIGLNKFKLKLLYGNLFNDDVIAETACLYNLNHIQHFLEIVPKRLFLVIEHKNDSNDQNVIDVIDVFSELKQINWIRKVADLSEYTNSHSTIVGRHTFAPFLSIQGNEASIVLHDIICELSKILHKN